MKFEEILLKKSYLKVKYTSKANNSCHCGIELGLRRELKTMIRNAILPHHRLPGLQQLRENFPHAMWNHSSERE